MQIYSFSVNYTNFQDFFFHFSPQKEELFRQNKGQKEELFRNIQQERDHPIRQSRSLLINMITLRR